MNFDYRGYPLRFVQKERCNDGTAHKFTLVYTFFSPVTKYKYVVRADYHEEDVFAVKFYCKKDKRSDFKYSKVINRGDVGNILISCLLVIPVILKQYPTASFSFIGAPTLDSSSEKLERAVQNQRYRIYAFVAAKRIGTLLFSHKKYPHISGYLLLNNACENLVQKEAAIKAMFQRTYNNVHDLPAEV